MRPRPRTSPDLREALLPLAEAIHEVEPDGCRVRGVLALDEVDCRDRGGAADGVAAVRVPVRTALPLLHQLLLGHHKPDRHPAPQTLGERHDVGDDSEMLRGEHLARAPDPRLHFVEDEQDTVLVAERPEPGEESVRRHEVSALALDRLDQDPGDLRRGDVVLEEHVLDVVEDGLPLIRAGQQRSEVVRIRDMRDAGHRGKESGLLRVLAGRERESAHRPAMEAAEEPDETRTSRDVARELERALDGFGSTLAHKTHRGIVTHRLQVAHTLSEAHLLLMPVVAGDVQEALRGLRDRTDDFRMRVSGRTHRDARREVEEAVPVHVPHFRALAVRHHERVVARIRWRDHLGVAGNDRLGLGAGKLGRDVRVLHWKCRGHGRSRCLRIRSVSVGRGGHVRPSCGRSTRAAP